MVIAIANCWVAGEIRFEGIALGSAAAIIVYHVMKTLSKICGTSIEAASPANSLLQELNFTVKSTVNIMLSENLDDTNCDCKSNN